MTERKHGQGRLVWTLAGVVALMFAFGFALAPLYSLYCEWTGLRSTGGNSPAAVTAGPVSERVVTVRFDANVASGLPWEFKPLDRKREVRLGEVAEVRFLAHNRAPEAVVGQAIPSVVPWQATEYFNKTVCFCFQEQRLEPGEAREMTVRFVVSPNLPEGINSLTLSYTFMNRDAQSAKKFERAGAQTTDGQSS
jgi:cytochrome c oxidase assembly protein subunit 11